MIACPYNPHIYPFRCSCDQLDPPLHIAVHTHNQLRLKILNLTKAFLSYYQDSINRIINMNMTLSLGSILELYIE